MRSFTRRLATATAAALLAAGVAVPPATAGLGPAVIDDHDSFIAPRAYELSSSASGTVFGTDDGGFGRLFLAAAPMTTGTPLVDLGPRPRTARAATINGARVAIPQAGSAYGAPVTQVRTCIVGACPAMLTVTTPALWQYAGNAGDAAVVFSPTQHKLGVMPWTSGAAPTATWDLPAYDETPNVVADATGIAVSGGGQVTYVNRTANTVHALDYGDGAVLTSTDVVWYAVGVGTEPTFDETRIYRVARSTTEPAPTPTTVQTLFGSPAIELLAANDTGIAYTIPNDDEEGTAALWTATYAGTPVRYARPLTTSALSTFENTAQFLVNDRLAGIPGLYKVTAGAYSGTLTGLVPVRGAVTHSLAVSHGRALYVDDTTADLPMWLRTVADGSPGPESVAVSRTAGSVAMSGPYFAYTRPRSASLVDVVYGRVGGATAYKILAASDVGRLAVSGRRVLLSGGLRARVIDIPTGAETDLGHSYGALFGEYLALIDYDTAAVTRRNLDNGTVQVVREAATGCTETCVDDDNWHLGVWGSEVVYAFGHGGTSPTAVSGLWDGNTGSTTATPMLTSAGEQLVNELVYWSGLLLVARNDASVRLYEMRNALAEHTIDTFAEEPIALDGNVAAWRPLSNLKAVVQDVREIVPGHVPALRYVGGVQPSAFGTDAAPEWKPTFLLSQNMTGSLVIHSGSPTGTVVKSIPVGALNGEISTAWDGTNADDEDVPQGTYYWTLETASVTPEVVKRANGTSNASGAVFVSRTPLGAPSLTAPALSTDVSTTARFPISWSVPAGAPSGTRYVVQRSINGGAFATSTTTAANSLSWGGTPGTTYRFRVAAVDPAGRQGAFSAVKTTIVPFNENAAGSAFAGSWPISYSGSAFGGSHRYSSSAGATYTFKSVGTAIYLIGNRGTNYGQFQVSIDGGAYSGLVDAYASSAQVRKVVFARGGLTNTTHTIKVRVYGTRTRPYVSVDAIGFLR
ncbi:MAG TPA: FlgD immunoglobulin-like domain containing protein [Mycobacteriales bacterium]|jgi:hypothetical protein